MKEYLRLEALDFGMASPQRYEAALTGAGFQDVVLKNRNRWYHALAQAEVKRMKGAQAEQFKAILGEDGWHEEVALWEAMIVVLATGEHCPHHFRGRKPA